LVADEIDDSSDDCDRHKQSTNPAKSYHTKDTDSHHGTKESHDIFPKPSLILGLGTTII
jgi:hypothetical protein